MSASGAHPGADERHGSCQIAANCQLRHAAGEQAVNPRVHGGQVVHAHLIAEADEGAAHQGGIGWRQQARLPRRSAQHQDAHHGRKGRRGPRPTLIDLDTVLDFPVQLRHQRRRGQLWEEALAIGQEM